MGKYNPEWSKNYYETHKDYFKNYYQKNKEKIIKQIMAKYDKERAALYARKATIRNKKLVFTHYSNGSIKCACCGEPNISFLSIDHVNNDGNKHRRAVSAGLGGTRFYYWLIKNDYPDEYQVLCMNCNWGKRLDGICPHQKV